MCVVSPQYDGEDFLFFLWHTKEKVATLSQKVYWRNDVKNHFRQGSAIADPFR
jgi:hypothetical protein